MATKAKRNTHTFSLVLGAVYGDPTYSHLYDIVIRIYISAYSLKKLYMILAFESNILYCVVSVFKIPMGCVVSERKIQMGLLSEL